MRGRLTAASLGVGIELESRHRTSLFPHRRKMRPVNPAVPMENEKHVSHRDLDGAQNAPPTGLTGVILFGKGPDLKRLFHAASAKPPRPIQKRAAPPIPSADLSSRSSGMLKGARL